ncbi:MAG: lipid A export permease/ATP-binding protein MsbA [Gammaproteobacteria bacterium]
MSKNKSKSGAVYSRLLGYAKPFWVMFLIGILGTILSSLVDAGFSYAPKPLLDKAFINRDALFIAWLPIFVVTAFILRAGSAFTSDYFISAVGRNVVMKLRQELFSKMLKLPTAYYDKKSAGHIISTIIYNVEQVAQASSDALLTIIREVFFISGLITVMLINSWQITLLFGICAPFIAIIAKFSSKKMRKFGKHLQTGMGDMTHITEEAIEGYKVIRTFGAQEYENNKFVKATLHNLRRDLQIIFTDALASPAVQVTVSIVVALAFYVATKSTSHLTAGGFSSVIAAMLLLLKPLKNITNVNNAIQKGLAGAEGIFEFLDEPIEQDTGTKHITRAKGDVIFEHVNFTYPEHEKSVLNQINFHVKPGETIALVGKSGSGKTTLVGLLPRFYDNYEGRILLDDLDIRELKLQDLRNQFSFVSQHVTLFNDTIEKNIAYGPLANATQAEIEAAAVAANAMEFISQLPNGFKTLIGENGLMLSGGQRQRIAIARAILRDAPILIMDEATSALDTESERYIQAALENLMKDRTTFIIAHRLSTIENADRIFVLKEGRIIETGSHAQLISHGGEYARLHALQFREVLQEA